jgi:hypothetical protein
MVGQGKKGTYLTRRMLSRNASRAAYRPDSTSILRAYVQIKVGKAMVSDDAKDDVEHDGGVSYTVEVGRRSQSVGDSTAPPHHLTNHAYAIRKQCLNICFFAIFLELEDQVCLMPRIPTRMQVFFFGLPVLRGHKANFSDGRGVI